MLAFGKMDGTFKKVKHFYLQHGRKLEPPETRKGIDLFTKEPCVFKAKPASKTVRALAMKKLKEMIN